VNTLLLSGTKLPMHGAPHRALPHAATHRLAGRSRGARTRAQASHDRAAHASGHISDQYVRLRDGQPPTRRCRRCAPPTPLPAGRRTRTSNPPAPQRGRELKHAHPAVAHALSGVGKCAAVLSGVARRRFRFSPPPPRRISARWRCAVEAPRHGLGAAGSPPPTAQAAQLTRAAGMAVAGGAGSSSRASGRSRVATKGTYQALTR